MGLNILAWAALAYFVGALPTDRVVARVPMGPGGPRINVARLLTALLDFLKGVALVWLAARYGWSAYALTAAGVAVVAGQSFPFWRGKYGDMGLWTAAGALAVAAPAALLIGALVWAVVFGGLRRSGVATLVAASITPLSAALLHYPPAAVLMALGVSLLVFASAASHRGDASDLRQ